MPQLFGRNYPADTLKSFLGDMSQLAGIRRCQLSEGSGKGSEIASVNTGAGFCFDVLLDRGLDISAATYCGAPLAWRSPAGDAHPYRYEAAGAGWLRGFPGGLVSTCGLNQCGPPACDDGEDLGLHGRYTSCAAENVSIKTAWQDGEYWLEVAGDVRQGCLFGENFLLRRRITTCLGMPGLEIHDVVENQSPRPQPHMILYHCNFGFPLLSPHSYVQMSKTATTPRDETAAAGVGQALEFAEPTAGYAEQVFYHETAADSDGWVRVVLANPQFHVPAVSDGAGEKAQPRPLALQLSYRKDQLPHFTQWKMMGQQEYICGLEPGNVRVDGRAAERQAGRLVILQPGESRTYHLKIEMV